MKYSILTYKTLSRSVALALLILFSTACEQSQQQTMVSPEPTNTTTQAHTAPEIVVYKSPTCGCCAKWNDHLSDAGFIVEAHDMDDMNAIKGQHGLPADLRSCHTAIVDGYVIEGHVPAADIQKLLQARPDIKGLAVPGMPLGSPGMEHPNPQAYEVIAWEADGTRSVFSEHGP